MTTSIRKTLSAFRRDDEGAVVIETAFVVPILAVLVLGGFEASMIVSRHAELQASAAEAAAITLVRAPDDAVSRNQLEDVIEASSGLGEDGVTLTRRFRCDTDTTLKLDASNCPTTAVISEYLDIRMTDTYTPTWTGFGIGKPITYDITRRVQIS